MSRFECVVGAGAAALAGLLAFHGESSRPIGLTVVTQPTLGATKCNCRTSSASSRSLPSLWRRGPFFVFPTRPPSGTGSMAPTLSSYERCHVVLPNTGGDDLTQDIRKATGLRPLNCTWLQCAPNEPRCNKTHAKSREGTAAIAYITANYHHLPERIAFVHGHAASWHSASHSRFAPRGRGNFASRLVDAIGMQNEDYVSLGTRFVVPVPEFADRYRERALRLCTELWPITAPHMAGKACPALREFCFFSGAEFVVSRAAIRRWPLAMWKRIASKFMGDDAKLAGQAGQSNGFSYIWELSSHVLFGEPPCIWQDKVWNMSVANRTTSCTIPADRCDFVPRETSPSERSHRSRPMSPASPIRPDLAEPLDWRAPRDADWRAPPVPTTRLRTAIGKASSNAG